MKELWLKKTKGTFRGPFVLPLNMRDDVPSEFKTATGITFTETNKLKFVLPKAIVSYLRIHYTKSFEANK